MATPYSEKFKAARKAAGFTQKTCAETYGIPRRTIEDWEGGKRIPPDYIQFFILEHFDRLADDSWNPVTERLPELPDEDIVRRLKADNARWAQVCREQDRRIDELEGRLIKVIAERDTALDELEGSMK